MTFENPTQKRGPTEGSAGTALTALFATLNFTGKEGRTEDKEKEEDYRLRQAGSRHGKKL